MSLLLAASGNAAVSRATPIAYDVSVANDWAEVDRVWAPLVRTGGAATPFQELPWLAAWYACLGSQPGVLPLLVTVRERGSGRIAAALPLTLARSGGLRVIAFADDGITDYNAAILGPAAPQDAAGWRALAQAVRAALPRADLLRLEKLAGPTALWPGARDSTLFGNLIRIGDSYETYHRSNEKTFRKELERSWRVFQRHPGAALRRVRTRAEADSLMDALERLQRERIAELGLPYILDRPDIARHYRRLVAEGIEPGSTVLTALVAGDDVVAALFGLRAGEHYAMVRLAVTGDETWRNTSPGRLLIAQTMEHLHGEGARIFDFTIGEYAYKRRFNVERVPLATVLAPLSARGALVCAVDRAKRLAKRSDLLVRLRRRLRPAPQTDVPF
ncbi:GNAT family N-acetyltransferase [Methylobacterium symbioticum]|uniref:BioF2-like acetyltransferase domain-containing protein n=1 Tax=Methylobacterium symbioticum TaxID=2584084 RepID=A0A509E985_9HYPH|nr:GNAT family N-acetyltransferase [Methylobacterium symbioticum]VUD70234.1 hypothetical protein MET9862_00798 [Methylobacterium symbioticum]